MAHINLLPWRQELRQERQRQFVTTLVLSLVATGALLYYATSFVGGLVDYQERRNDLLRTEIKKMDKKIEEIKQLQETKRRLLERMRIIEQLQQQRAEVVHLFDELVETLPDGVHLISLDQNGDQITLKGRAQSNARVSDYMRRLEASDWFTNPRLEVIETKQAEPSRVSEFSLKVKQTAPKPDDESDGSEKQATS